ncbi:MAG TPA: hypothetical protein ENN51_05410 [candidate division WOR-3 bacterium]|uniref:Uncharacterized protein n=1 Tax=candidate division WOR-3 bacterium TaxID=2052148 RepID=A0A7V0T5T0_UNCW3|nr:hypothetical protein [candidate division WOR-3 bacterium]
MNYDSSSPGGRFLPGILLALLAALVFTAAVCEQLFGEDTRPPDCRIVQPTDSSAVSGLVTVRAEASDSSGVRSVEVFLNDSLLATLIAPPYTTKWDAREEPAQSWHTLYCRATDVYDNVGVSDTVRVQVWHGGERDVFHGAFRLEPNRYWLAGFTAEPGDTLAGDFRVLAERALSRFIWLDADNARRFRGGETYVPVIEHANRPGLTLRESVPAADSFYLVFLNTGGTRVDVWARFTLE